MKKISGFTLIELMVSLSLGAFLMFGIIKLITLNQKFFRQASINKEISATTQAAIKLLEDLAKQAGHRTPVDPLYIGCYPLGHKLFATASSQPSLTACVTQTLKQLSSTFGTKFNDTVNTYFSDLGQPPATSPGQRRYTYEPNVVEYPINESAPIIRDSDTGSCGVSGLSVYSIVGKNVLPPFNGTLGNTTNSITGTGDILQIKFQGEQADTGYPTLTDCFGNTVDQNTVVTNNLAVAPATINGTTINSLVCQTIRQTSSISGSGVGTSITPTTSYFPTNNPDPTTWDVLIPGVDAMRVLFGMDTHYGTFPSNPNIMRTGPDGAPNQYLPISTLTTTGPLNPASVANIKVAILIRSLTGLPGYTNGSTYSLLGYTHGPYNDAFTRKTVVTTLSSLENLPAYRLEQTIYPSLSMPNYAQSIFGNDPSSTTEVLTTDWLGESAVFVQPLVEYDVGYNIPIYGSRIHKVMEETIGNCLFSFACDTTVSQENGTMQLQAGLNVFVGTTLFPQPLQGLKGDMVSYGDTVSTSMVTISPTSNASLYTSCNLNSTITVGCKFRKGADRWTNDLLLP